MRWILVRLALVVVVLVCHHHDVVVSFGLGRYHPSLLSSIPRVLGRCLEFKTATTTTILRLAMVELASEPDGGEEVIPLASMPGSRLKQMNIAKGIKSDLGQPYEFWMTAEVDASLIKEIQKQILQDAKKKANFPGFRKGQVPPYAMPQIMEFSVEEAIVKTVEAAVEAYGLKSLPGSDGKFTVKEDVSEISRGYQLGTNVQFTATMNAVFDPENNSREPPVEVGADSAAIDVAAELVDAETAEA